MRGNWTRVFGAAVVVATVATGAAALQIDPDIVTKVSAASTGVWIPVEVSGEIVHIDGGSGEITARVQVAESGALLEVQERAGSVVVVDRTAGRVSLVDPALHEVVREVSTVSGAGGLVDIGPSAVVIASGSELSLVDQEVTASTSIDLGGDAVSVAADGAAGVAALSDAIVRVGADGVGETTPIVDASVVRVGTEVMEIVGRRVSDSSDTTRACLTRALDRGARLTGDDSGWLIVTDGGVVQVADVHHGWCREFKVGKAPVALGRPVVASGLVFVPEAGSVHIINPVSRVSSSHTVSLGAAPVQLRSRGEVVAAFSATSNFAALLDADGIIDFVNTSPDSRDFQAVLGEEGATAIVGGGDEDPAVGLDGLDGVERAAAAPVIDAAVLAATITNPAEPEVDQDPVLPVDDLIANFAFSAATVAVGEPVRFVDESSGAPESWVWDFGDGTGAEGPEVQKAWDEPGTYAVTLHIARGEESAEIILAITVVPVEVILPPAADFVFSSTVVNVGNEVAFQDRSDGQIDRWRWDFGDGTTGDSPDVTKSWATPGRYTVRLTVANDQGADSAVVVIEVIENLLAPIAVLEASATTVEVGAPLGLTGSSATDPAAFIWDLGDGRTSRGPSVVAVYLQEGTYTVTLFAANDAGIDTAEVKITVEPAILVPIARVATLPAIIEVNDVVRLTSLSSNGPEAEKWVFGDGTAASGQVVDHAWTAAGTYLVSLTATNKAGSDTTVVVVEVVAELPPPLAVIGGFDPTPWVNDVTAFLDASHDATSWLWNFGDGATSTSPNALHTFTSAGQKTVTLTVMNRNGSNTTSVTVEPRLRPVADFAASTAAPRAGQLVDFADLSVNAFVWAWNFGDGALSSSPSPQHAYATAGTYFVTLTVTSPTGDQDTTLPRQINVDPAAPTLAPIVVGVNPGTTLAVMGFQGSPGVGSGPINVFEINYGDGSLPEQAVGGQFAHAYAVGGAYVVTMRAQGPLLDWSPIVTLNVSVVDPPLPLIAIAAPATGLVGPVTLTGTELLGSGPIAGWQWSISGGGLAVPVILGGRVVDYTFGSAGVYQVSLTATGPVSSTTVGPVAITITNPPPPVITSLVASADPVTVGALVQFLPTVTGSVATWEWDYENNGTFVVGASPGEHIFNLAGLQTVSLRVTDPFGGSALASVSVTVLTPPDPTVPSPSLTPPFVTGATVTFTSAEALGDPVSQWNWNVTNGVTSVDFPNQGPSLAYAFPSAGSWTITVTAIGPSGASGTDLLLVTVVDPPVANFSFSIVGLAATFTDLSSGSVDTWSWNFGDGSGVSSLQSPLYTYAAPGTYTVSLTVTAGAQTSVPVTMQVTIL